GSGASVGTHLHAGHRSRSERPQVHRPRPRRLRRPALRNGVTMAKKSPNGQWKTALTCIEPNRILVRGYPLDEMMGRLSFGEAIYLLLVGEVPGPAIGRLVEALLVSFIDHGVTPPPTLAARNVTTTGAATRNAVAAGVLGFGKFYGGDIQACRHLLDEGIALTEQGRSYRQAAVELVDRVHERQDLFPGFGHRYHQRDPR